MEHQLHRLSDRELIDAFLDPICERIVEREADRLEALNSIDEKLSFIESLPDDKENVPVYEEILKHSDVADLVEIEAELNRLHRLLSIAHGRESSDGTIPKEKVRKANSFPLESIFRDVEFRASGKYLKGLCPFHAEKTPSFHIYPEDNHFHCFGCRAHGDAINAEMRLTGCSFREAVARFLGETLS